MPETMIITGAAGFIGSHLARWLLASRDDLRIVGIDNFDSFYSRGLKERNIADLPADRFELREMDICDRAELTACMKDARPSAVFHLAALAGVRPSLEDPGRYMNVNIGGTVSVMEAVRASGCRVIVFASSSSVYGNRADDARPFGEDDDVTQTISPYAASKVAGETTCRAYAEACGLRAAMIRFFTVYGPAQRPDLAIARFMRRIAADEPITMFGDGTTARDYTYIDDIIRGILAAHQHVRLQPGGFCRVWNLGGAAPVLLRDLIAAIGRTTGREPKIERDAMQPGDVVRTFADLSRVRTELSWEPQIALEDGLARQWAWMRERTGELSA